jgi:hypothetical protein
VRKFNATVIVYAFKEKTRNKNYSNTEIVHEFLLQNWINDNGIEEIFF